MPDTPLLLFSHRRRLSALYQKWCRDNLIKDCPESLIAFLHEKGLLKERKVQAYLEEQKGVNADV